MNECPHCGQPMQMKFGIRFTRQQADFLGMIEDVTKGRGGIHMDSLTSVFFPGVSTAVAMNRVRVIVCQINDKLASTDWRISCHGPLHKRTRTGKTPLTRMRTGYYRLEEIKMRNVA